MGPFIKNKPGKFFVRSAIQQTVSIILLLLVCFSQAAAHRAAGKPGPKKQPPARGTLPVNKRRPGVFRPRRRTPDIVNKESQEEVTLLFTLDWTSCQIHRVNRDEPVEIILNGTIESNSPEIWTLFPVQPKPEITPDLHYVENVHPETGSGTERKTPLEWTISLDKGMPEPMTILPDNSLTYTFPEGRHSFQVRITGKVERDQPAGYYRLQLAHSLAPQL